MKTAQPSLAPQLVVCVFGCLALVPVWAVAEVASTGLWPTDGPESAHLPNGELSEYVAPEWVDGRLTWVPAQIEGGHRGFLHRARVDIELVVDGDVIDLNFTHLPDHTRIIDKRGLLPEEEAE